MADASLAEIESRLARVEAELIRWTEDEFRDLRSCLMNLLVYVTDIEQKYADVGPSTRDVRAEAQLFPTTYSQVYPAGSVLLAESDLISSIFFGNPWGVIDHPYFTGPGGAYIDPFVTSTKSRPCFGWSWKYQLSLTEQHIPQMTYSLVPPSQPDVTRFFQTVGEDWVPTTNDPYPAYGFPLELVSGPNASLGNKLGVFKDAVPYNVKFPWVMNTFENCCNPNCGRPSISQCNFPALTNQLPFWIHDTQSSHQSLSLTLRYTYVSCPSFTYSLHDPDGVYPELPHTSRVFSWQPFGDYAFLTYVLATVRYPDDAVWSNADMCRARGRVM